MGALAGHEVTRERSRLLGVWVLVSAMVARRIRPLDPRSPTASVEPSRRAVAARLAGAVILASALGSAVLPSSAAASTTVTCPGTRFVGPSSVSVPAPRTGNPDCAVKFGGGTIYTAALDLEIPISLDSQAESATFSETGHLLRFTDAAGDATSFASLPGEVLTTTDALGHVTSFTYDQAGRLISDTDSTGTTSFTYDSAGHLASAMDPAGHTTTFSYDQSGRLISDTDSSGTTSFTYDSAGHLVSEMDPAGHTTTFSYDQSGRLISDTDSSGTTSFTYDSAGHLVSEMDPTGHTTTFSYDQSGRLISDTDSSGTTSFSYDATGRLVSEMDPAGHTTTFSYDQSGRLISDTDSSGTTNFSYDSTGRLVSVTESSGNTTRFTYSPPATCALTGVSNGPPKQIQITVQDAGSGLQSIVVTSQTNDTVQVPAFTAGTTSPQVVTATKINPSLGSQVGLRVTDRAGDVTNCDPTIVSLQPYTHRPQPVTTRNVPQAEHFITIAAGSPSPTVVLVVVNGLLARVVDLDNGQTTTIDVSSSTKPGDHNTITLVALGKRHASATAVIHS